MWHIPDLSHRAEARELMDDPTIGGHDLAESLVQLRRINWALGAAFPTLEGVEQLWRQVGRPAHLTLLDVGAGSGDGNRLLLRWASLRRVHLRITLLDLHAETCALAADYYRDEPRVRVQQGDLHHLPPRSADIVTAALVLHHIPAPQLPEMLRTLARAARLGVVINDLHRHTLAWLGIRLLTRLFSRNRLIRHDAPLSVQRGFRPADFERLRALPDLRGLRYRWRPLFRYLITVPPLAPNAAPDIPAAGAQQAQENTHV
jgi:2-polyprenyl-3-methyl-5-hydroxy-6-metoxy-1,4-benzoquinol methylase